MDLSELRYKFSRIFDDNLRTVQWKNMVDYLIMFMIFLSTVEVFLSTFEWNDNSTMRAVLHIVDIITLAFFTVEVVLRIWTAPELFPSDKKWKSRMKYCFSFYGIIDIISTFPFYIQWLVPVSSSGVKALRLIRTIRILRFTRYFKSFKLLSGAISSKKHELLISMQFLLIVTLVLSIVLYYAENKVQPDVYDNGLTSTLWAFAQYIGDPGEFASNPPITPMGKVVAFIVGILGIAIVAVPAGILGSGFTEAIEEDKRFNTVKSDVSKLRNAFQRKQDRPTGFQVIPPYIVADDAKVLLNMKADNINDAVEYGQGFRLVNLASSIPRDRFVPDRVAIEHFPVNRPYGCMIDRGSKVTIINPSAVNDVGVGNFAFYLALIGGFNYISRELGDRAPYQSFYTFDDANDVPNLSEYVTDLQQLLNRPGGWGVTILVCSGALEPTYPTNIHLAIGGAKGDQRMSGDDLFVHDEETYRRFYESLETEMKDKFNLTIDQQVYIPNRGPKVFVRKLKLNKDVNNVIIRIEWDKLLWDSRRIQLASSFAQLISNNIAEEPMPDNMDLLKKKAIGFDGYDI